MKQVKFIIAVGVVLAAALSNVGCGKKNSDNNNGPVYTAPTGGVGGVQPASCQNCNFPQGSLFNVTTQSANMQINWQILGDQNTIQQIASFGWNPQKTYQGPALVAGTALLNQDLLAGNCIIPAGQYQISTTQVGMAQTGPVFSIPQVVLQNTQSGLQILAQVYNAVPVFDVSTNQAKNFFGYLIFQQAPIYQYTFGQQAGVTGALGNCSGNGGTAFVSFGNSSF